MEKLDWLYDAVGFYAQFFGLSEWEIEVKVERVLNSDEYVIGSCKTHPSINHARIKFRDDIENTVEWHEVILHELFHVAHGRIDNYLEQIVFPLTGNEQTNDTYCSVVYEPFIHALAKNLSPLLFAEWKEAYAESNESGTDENGSDSGGNPSGDSTDTQDNTKQRRLWGNNKHRVVTRNTSMRLRP